MKKLKEIWEVILGGTIVCGGLFLVICGIFVGIYHWNIKTHGEMAAKYKTPAAYKYHVQIPAERKAAQMNKGGNR